MINFKSDFSYHSYSLPEEIIKERYYIDIYYKNMRIKWVLEDFSLKEIDTLSNIITKATKHVHYNKISKSFICNNKWGWNKIEQILMNHYYSQKKKFTFPDNLISLSLDKFIQDKYEW